MESFVYLKCQNQNITGDVRRTGLAVYLPLCHRPRVQARRQNRFMDRACPIFMLTVNFLQPDQTGVAGLAVLTPLCSFSVRIQLTDLPAGLRALHKTISLIQFFKPMTVFPSDAMKGCRLSECLHVSLSKCPLESQLGKLEEKPS